MNVVWYDPGLIRVEVFYGTLIIIASVIYIVFALFFSNRFRGAVRWILPLTLLVILLSVQLFYVSSSSIVIYGVVFDEQSGTFQTYTATNPIVMGVVVMSIATLVIGGAVTGYYVLEGSIARLPGRRRKVYIEA